MEKLDLIKPNMLFYSILKGLSKFWPFKKDDMDDIDETIPYRLNKDFEKKETKHALPSKSL